MNDSAHLIDSLVWYLVIVGEIGLAAFPDNRGPIVRQQRPVFFIRSLAVFGINRRPNIRQVFNPGEIRLKALLILRLLEYILGTAPITANIY